ncbi:hypothetical protein [Kitasatospora sp. NPDC098663]|uniref:hypothetical protein n=1 Tax=Kitasatospora sp. NPDC098663 TaxID=3364096 RepID=UPI0038308784
MKPTIIRPAQVLAAGLLAAGAAVFLAVPNAFAVSETGSPGSPTTVTVPARSASGAAAFVDTLAEPGRTTAFHRDTLWQLTAPDGSAVEATPTGGIQFVGADGSITAGYTPAPMVDTEGIVHDITWSLEGTTLRQHVDITTDSIQGTLQPALHAQPRDGYWDCVTDTGKGGLAGGLVTGCVAGAETGCAPGAAVGGFAGGLGGIATGLVKC